MAKNSKIISSVSKKTKLNVITIVFIIFIIISILSSINPVLSMFKKKETINAMQSELNESRSRNIELLALEKSLYKDKFIDREAFRQFGIFDDENKIIYQVNEIDKLERFNNTADKNLITDDAVYSNNNLWGNIKILYYKEIYK